MIPISRQEADIVRAKFKDVFDFCVTTTNKEHPSRAKSYYMTVIEEACRTIADTNDSAKQELIEILKQKLRRTRGNKEKVKEIKAEIRSLQSQL